MAKAGYVDVEARRRERTDVVKGVELPEAVVRDALPSRVDFRSSAIELSGT